MKRMVLIILAVMSAVSFSFAQDSSLMDTAVDQADAAVIIELLGDMRIYHYSGDDTYVQVQAKQRQLQAALVRINAQYRGKLLTLRRMTLDDVTPERVGDGFLNCRETGKYEAAFSIHYGPAFDYLTVEILKIYPNEHSVIDLKKGNTMPVTGWISSISYTAVSERLIIRLK